MQDKDTKTDFNFNKFGIGVEDICEEAQHQFENAENSKFNTDLFLSKPINQWLEETKDMSAPKRLFDDFWFEDELCLLFAEPGAGKSILGVEIANSISKGEPILGFRMEASAQVVLYFDFELSAMQWALRYSHEKSNYYYFSDNFIRIEINPDAEIPSNEPFESYLKKQIEEATLKTGGKVLIIDNITYLSSDNEKAKDALPLMKELKKLKKKYGLSILALGHIPKRDCSLPLTRNDLAGSKHLMNFADSSFAIGESVMGPSNRYLKQIKQRNVASLYSSDNVCLCRITKPEIFTTLEWFAYGKETEQLQQRKKNLAKKDVILFLYNDCSLKNQSEIARILSCDQSYVNKCISGKQV